MTNRQELINILQEMTDEEFNRIANIDTRRWYYVVIDDKDVPWWACDNELDDLKERYENIEFKLIPYEESIKGGEY